MKKHKSALKIHVVCARQAAHTNRKYHEKTNAGITEKSDGNFLVFQLKNTVKDEPDTCHNIGKTGKLNYEFRLGKISDNRHHRH